VSIHAHFSERLPQSSGCYSQEYKDKNEVKVGGISPESLRHFPVTALFITTAVRACTALTVFPRVGSDQTEAASEGRNVGTLSRTAT
jgi:hypothetical protein